MRVLNGAGAYNATRKLAPCNDIANLSGTSSAYS